MRPRYVTSWLASVDGETEIFPSDDTEGHKSSTSEIGHILAAIALTSCAKTVKPLTGKKPQGDGGEEGTNPPRSEKQSLEFATKEMFAMGNRVGE